LSTTRVFCPFGQNTVLDNNAHLPDPTEPLDRATQLVRGRARVPLRRVEVLVPERLLDLASINDAQ
jgi:hypothetical protein